MPSLIFQISSWLVWKICIRNLTLNLRLMSRLYVLVVLVSVEDAGEWLEQSKKKHRNVTR